MGCCQKLFANSGKTTRSILCLKRVSPIRIVTLISLAGTSYYTMKNIGNLPALTVLLILLHLFLACSALNECRRSVVYHKMMDGLSGDKL